MRVITLLLVLVALLSAERQVTLPVTSDIAIGSEKLLDYVTSVNKPHFDTLFICNFVC